MKILSVLRTIIPLFLLSCTFSFEQQAFTMHKKALTLDGLSKFRAESSVCSLLVVAESISPTGISAYAQDCFYDAAFSCLDYLVKEDPKNADAFSEIYLMLDSSIYKTTDSLQLKRYSSAVFSLADRLFEMGIYYSATDAAEKAMSIHRDSSSTNRFKSLNQKVIASIIEKAKHYYSMGCSHHDTNALICAEFLIRTLTFCNGVIPDTLASKIYQKSRSVYCNYSDIFDSVPDLVLWKNLTFTKVYLAVDTIRISNGTTIVESKMLNSLAQTIDILFSEFALITANDEQIRPLQSIVQNCLIQKSEEARITLVFPTTLPPRMLMYDKEHLHLEKYVN